MSLFLMLFLLKKLRKIHLHHFVHQCSSSLTCFIKSPENKFSISIIFFPSLLSLLHYFLSFYTNPSHTFYLSLNFQKKKKTQKPNKNHQHQIIIFHSQNEKLKIYQSLTHVNPSAPNHNFPFSLPPLFPSSNNPIEISIFVIL
jgi:hypothetical protein